MELSVSALAEGVKKINITLTSDTVLTVHDYVTQVICPEPGKTPPFLKSINLSAISQYMKLENKAKGFPYCEGNFLSFIAEKALKYTRDRFGASNRKDYCGYVLILIDLV